MIKFDGYYLRVKGSLFEEGRPGPKWYHFEAYRFFRDGTFLTAISWSRSDNWDSVECVPSDFKEEYRRPYKYVDGGLVLFFNLGTVWEVKTYLKPTEEGVLEYENGDKLKFKPWNKRKP